jgi:hypothetical protein
MDAEILCNLLRGGGRGRDDEVWMGPERYQKKKFGSSGIFRDPSWPRQCVNAQENDGDLWSCSDTWFPRLSLLPFGFARAQVKIVARVTAERRFVRVVGVVPPCTMFHS